MAGVFLESFDIYDNANASTNPSVLQANQASLLTRWTGLSSGTACKTTNIGSRTGSSCLSLSVGDSVSLTVPHQNRYICGMAASFNDLTKMGTTFVEWSTANLNGVTFSPLFRSFINTNGTISMFAFNNLIATSTFAMSNATYYYIEFDVFFSIVGGNVQTTAQCYVNNTLVAGGAATTGVAPSFLLHLDEAVNVFTVGSPALNVSGNALVDDLYLIDTTTGHNNTRLGPGVVGRLLPNGDVVTVWTPSTAGPHFSLVNEIPEDADASYVESSTSGQHDIYTYELATMGSVIVFVQISSCLRRTDEGKSIAQSCWGSTGGLQQSPQFSPGGNYAYYRDILDVDPNTTSPWTVSGFNAEDKGVLKT